MHGMNGCIARSKRTAALLELACRLGSREFAEQRAYMPALRQVLF